MKKEEVVIKKPSSYVKISNKLFSRFSIFLYRKGLFGDLKGNLMQANLGFLPVSYVSVILFSTLLAKIISLFVLVILLILGVGYLTSFLIFFIIPIATFIFAYFYPSMEKDSVKDKIDAELPFVTIHLSAISGSLVEPSKMFEIITLTKDYPYVSKEFRKVINEVNVYGYNLVNALRKSAENTASSKLRELFNGLATTITSGGDLQKFFEKRSQTLLFDYKLERERFTKIAETFMDIYISVVIAAPMIFMLLLMIMKISGLGIQLSVSMITLIMILGVSIINVLFLVFLHLKQPRG